MSKLKRKAFSQSSVSNTSACSGNLPHDITFCCSISDWVTFSDQISFLHLSDCRKQDGADPRISAPIEPQLLQPELTHSTSPLHKVGREDPGALSLNRDPLTLSVWPPLSVILCYYQSLHILSRVILSDVLFSPAFFCITCVIKAHKALWLQLLCLTDSINKGLFLAGNSQPHADKF